LMITLAKTIRRVVDAYVDRRDFDGSRPADTGRPGYYPSTLGPAEFSHGHENVSETPGNNGKRPEKWVCGRTRTCNQTVMSGRL
jgi:hypothetical protein